MWENGTMLRKDTGLLERNVGAAQGEGQEEPGGTVAGSGGGSELDTQTQEWLMEKQVKYGLNRKQEKSQMVATHLWDWC